MQPCIKIRKADLEKINFDSTTTYPDAKNEFLGQNFESYPPPFQIIKHFSFFRFITFCCTPRCMLCLDT